MHGDAQLDHHRVHGVLQDMAGAVSSEAGAPFGGAAELALGDEAGFFLELLHLHPVGQAAAAGDNPGPRHPPHGHLAYGHRSQLHEQAGHILVAAPIGAFDRVFKVNVRIVPVAHSHIAQGGLHAALGRSAVGPPGRNETQDGDLVAVHGGFNGHPLAGQTSADNQDISKMGVRPLHARPLTSMK